MLLLASPGTGKTRVLRARMAYLLLRERVPPEKILAVTFTQHAAHELQRHVHRMVDGALEGAWVGSFHATCLRMLRENHQLLALPAQVPVLPPSEQLALVRELMRSEHTPRAGAGAAGVLRCITLWKERGQMPPDLPPPTGRESACEVEARRLYPMYEEALRARGVLDVAGLTLAALRLLRMEPRVLAHYRERFQHVLVDELQDTSVVQYDWLHLLSGGTARNGAEAGAADVAGPAQSIFAAADDDQAIYSWRGADRANVLRFCRDFGAVQVLRLPNSYRCPAHVYAAAQALLPQSGSLLPKKAHTTKPFEKQTRVQLRGFWDSEEEAKWVAAQLHAKRASGLRYDQMAVLVTRRARAPSAPPSAPPASRWPSTPSPRGRRRGGGRRPTRSTPSPPSASSGRPPTTRARWCSFGSGRGCRTTCWMRSASARADRGGRSSTPPRRWRRRCPPRAGATRRRACRPIHACRGSGRRAPAGCTRCCPWSSATIRPTPAGRGPPPARALRRLLQDPRAAPRHLPPADEAEPGSARRRGGGGGGARLGGGSRRRATRRRAA